MKVTACGNSIVFRRIETHLAAAKSNIQLPDNIAELNSAHGIIVSVGPGQRDISGQLHPLPYQEGQHVAVNRLGIINLTVGPDALCVVKSGDILGIIEDEPKNVETLAT